MEGDLKGDRAVEGSVHHEDGRLGPGGRSGRTPAEPYPSARREEDRPGSARRRVTESRRWDDDGVEPGHGAWSSKTGVETGVENGPPSNETHVPPTGSGRALPEGEYEWKLGHHPIQHPALDEDTLMEGNKSAEAFDVNGSLKATQQADRP